MTFSNKTVFIEYISLNPSYRSQSNIFKIFDDVQQKFSKQVILSNFSLNDELKQWRQNKEKLEKDMKETD